MCLAVLAFHALPQTPVLIAANRDEFHARPTLAAAQWSDAPGVYAGRDARAGGTWMGVTDTGRFAVVTNFREPGRVIENAPSRGELVEQYLRGTTPPDQYLAMLHERAQAYNGFNLVLGTLTQTWYLSNRDSAPRQLAPGIYALSNHLLDTPWPKLARTKAAFTEVLRHPHQPDVAALFAALADKEPADDADLPETGLSLERERLLSSPFIVSPDYGTRSSCVIALHHNGQGELHERRFGPDGQMAGQSKLAFRLRVSPGI